MDKATAIERVRQYADVVRRDFNVKRIILFGSYSKDSPRKDSDIDVAVVLDRVEGDFLAAESKLFRLRREVDSRIEPVLLEAPNDRSGFLEEILKTGEVIYSSEPAT
jgi:predicted nucleotidyltransferase